MTAQMTHTNYRTATKARPASSRLETTPPDTTKPSETKAPNGRRGPRWIGPLVAIGAIGAIGVALVVNTNSDPTPAAETELSSSQQLVEASIDQALADNATTSDGSFATAEANRMNTLQDLSTPAPAAVSSQQLVEASIDQALADNATTSDGSFATAEANRMNTLQDLSTTASYIPECNIVGPC